VAGTRIRFNKNRKELYVEIIMDLSNIYNLPEEMLSAYRDNPFPDDEIRPGMVDFAKKFKAEILSLPTPYVMVLEGGYGVGKTYFITRFCEYLKKINGDNDISVPSVYLNLWENDYVANPLPVIVSQILYQMNPAKKLRDDITEKTVKITNNFIKFGAKAFLGRDIGDILPNPKQDKEDLQAFKSSLKKMVEDKGGKVVLVVDEIDRCRPDYAVKALETIKHFFDIEGLFVILTTKLDFMDSICEAYYGHPKCAINMGEGYIQKFVQSKKLLKPVSNQDYLFVMKSILNKDTLPIRINKVGGYYTLIDAENVKAIDIFVKNMAKIFYASELSVRKTVDICNEILELIKRNSENLWENKVDAYPEMMITRYLKRKNILKENIEEPKIRWQFPEDERTVMLQIERYLDNLL